MKRGKSKILLGVLALILFVGLLPAPIKGAPIAYAKAESQQSTMDSESTSETTVDVESQSATDPTDQSDQNTTEPEPQVTKAAESKVKTKEDKEGTDLSDDMSINNIQSNIQNAITATSPGGVITVTGSKTNEVGLIELNIPAGITVRWAAISSGLSFHLHGGGTFEVATGGKIEVTDKDAIVSTSGNVTVSGGEVSATRVLKNCRTIYVSSGNVTVAGGSVFSVGDYGSAIEIDTGNVTVTGGSVSADGNYGHYCYAICVNNSGTVCVKGGNVSAVKAMGESNAVYFGNSGLGAVLKDSCQGDFALWGNGIIVEVDSHNIPDAYGGTHNGLTRKAGSAIANVKWDTSGAIPVVSYQNGAFTVKWKAFEAAAPETPATEPVRLKETGELFHTMAKAISAAEGAGRSSFTLEIIGDVTETDHVDIDSNITILGAGGTHTISSNYAILVQNGGKLTLGSGKDTDILKISKAVHVTNGTVTVKDGVYLKDGSHALYLTGTNASGSISGGRFEANHTGVHLEKGAKLSEISGGVFTANQEALYLTDTGTKVEKISGGRFYQTDPDITLHGQAAFIQNGSQIGEISDGYFEATRSSAMVIIRGSWVDEISGGKFVAKRAGTYANNDRNGTLWIESENNKTGVGTISGGHFSGGYFGLLSVNRYSSGSQIDTITGGTFLGTVALQNDANCVIKEITGGEIIGSQAMLNAGKIGTIGGKADIQGGSSYGIFNYAGGQIDEISSGKITSTSEHGIANAGIIKLVSGGTIIGGRSAISCTGVNGGTLEKITNGVFWGKNDKAILLAKSLILEPDLQAKKGAGRYWGKDGVVFNDEKLVVFPINKKVNTHYEMSSETEPVAGIEGTSFKYLKLHAPPLYNVTVEESHADITGEGTYEEDETVTIHAGQQEGYTFTGWETENDIAFDEKNSETTTFTMPGSDVTVTATWKSDEANNPEEPDTPDKPDKPDKPEKPEKPDKPDKPNKPQKPNRPTLPQTGDVGMVLILIIAVVSLVILTYAGFDIIRNRKNRI